MPSKASQCFFSYIFGEKGKSQAVDDSVAEKAVRDPHAKGAYARHRANYDAEVSKSAPWTTKEFWADGFEKYTGVSPHDVAAFVRNPDAILGENVVSRIEGLYLDHLKRYGKDNAAAWRQAYKPQIQQLKNEVLNNLPPLYQDYAAKYFDFHERGGQLYARTESSNPFSKLVRNAVGNLVTWNPVISMMNVFEYTPKALAYAIEVAGPVNGPVAVMKAMSSYFAKTGGNFTKRLAEYEQLGIYGLDAPKLDILSATENPLRGLSAELAQVLGRNATEGVERVAFVNRYGNEMQALWTRSGADTITLMRFAISANKFYLNLIGKAAQGNVNAAVALAAFTGMTAIQTGGTSAIPAPIAFMLKQSNPEMLQAIKDFDQESKLNIASQLGMDIADKQQPLGGFALGVGFPIFTQDLYGGLKSVGKAAGDVREGDYGLATARLVDGLLGVGQVGRIPGINITTKRFTHAIVEQLQAEQELNLEGLTQEAKQQLGIIPK